MTPVEWLIYAATADLYVTARYVFYPRGIGAAAEFVLEWAGPLVLRACENDEDPTPT